MDEWAAISAMGHRAARVGAPRYLLWTVGGVMERSPVRGRALTAVLMLFTFAVLVVSGVVL